MVFFFLCWWKVMVKCVKNPLGVGQIEERFGKTVMQTFGTRCASRTKFWHFVFLVFVCEATLAADPFATSAPQMCLCLWSEKVQKRPVAFFVCVCVQIADGDLSHKVLIFEHVEPCTHSVRLWWLLTSFHFSLCLKVYFPEEFRTDCLDWFSTRFFSPIDRFCCVDAFGFAWCCYLLFRGGSKARTYSTVQNGPNPVCSSCSEFDVRWRDSSWPKETVFRVDHLVQIWLHFFASSILSAVGLGFFLSFFFGGGGPFWHPSPGRWTLVCWYVRNLATWLDEVFTSTFSTNDPSA